MTKLPSAEPHIYYEKKINLDTKVDLPSHYRRILGNLRVEFGSSACENGYDKGSRRFVALKF